MTTLKKMGRIIRLVRRLKFTLCVGRVGSTFTTLQEVAGSIPDWFLNFFYWCQEGLNPRVQTSEVRVT